MDASAHAPHVDVDAPYVAEMVRQQMEQSYGPAAETAGYRVYTTIDGRLQALANRAVQLGLIEYDRQQGWRGPIGRTVLAAGATPAQLEQLVDEYTPLGMLMPAVVVKVGTQDAGDLRPIARLRRHRLERALLGSQGVGLRMRLAPRQRLRRTSWHPATSCTW